MSVSADAVLLILQSRYDYQSARAVLKIAATHAGLDPAGPFEGAAIAKAILAVGEGVAGVAEALRKAGKAEPAKAEPAKAEAPKAEPPKAEPPKAAPPEAAPAEAPKADDAAPAEQAEAGDDAGDDKSKAKGRGRKG
ncbi:MAG: hypothetical protein H6706_04005 [Myxococcales bacterium]|nr:hypothetical protein [Myxococcales bacterium]